MLGGQRPFKRARCGAHGRDAIDAQLPPSAPGVFLAGAKDAAEFASNSDPTDRLPIEFLAQIAVHIR